MSHYIAPAIRTTDDREDVLIREDHTFAPWSVYVDVSPIDPSEAVGSFVSGVYRVWEHLDDTETLSRAVELLSVYSIDPEFAGQAIGVYSNNANEFVHDHPVFNI